MVRYIQQLTLFILISLVSVTGVYAESVSAQTSAVFKFQQKLALKGNAGAQFKLASMYESGSGVMQDIGQAKSWYDKAASAGNKAANDRRTYLSVKENGYDKTKNAAWLAGLQSDAKESKGDAMFLLAQLYRQGIGVKKDLNKSLTMFDQVSLLGAADVEEEIGMIQSEVAAKKKAKIKARKKREAAAAARIQKEQARQKQPVQQVKSQAVKDLQKGSQKAPQVEDKAAAAKKLQAEKIHRYEKAMMKLKLEQQLIDEQQKWAAGGKNTAEDDDEI